MHNIDKSEFRKGQYVGYGGGEVWRIRKESGRWLAVPQSQQSYKKLFYADKLSDVSAKLDAMEYNKNPRSARRGVLKQSQMDDGSRSFKLLNQIAAARARTRKPRNRITWPDNLSKRAPKGGMIWYHVSMNDRLIGQFQVKENAIAYAKALHRIHKTDTIRVYRK